MSALPADALIPPRLARAESLGDRITELCGYINAATCQLLDLIREFDKAQYWESLGLHSCAHWLNFHCGIGLNAAREKVRVAHALAELPRISRAFSRGEVSYSKVRAMTRIATPDNEDYLMMIARHGTAHHVEKLVSQYRRCRRLQDTENANDQHRARALHYRFDEDGSLLIEARLPSERGALMLKALQRAIDGDDVTAETPAEDAEAASDYSSFATRRADALLAMAEQYLASKPMPSSSADRYQVVVHVAEDTLAGDVTADTSFTDRSYLEDGPRIAAETSRRLACDCSRVRVVDDDHGEPLSIGRKSRTIPPAIRRALAFRDKGCRFPGCTHRRYLDGHHILHWADGGETALDNLVQLCRFHHRRVHEGGFGCRRWPGGAIEFLDPHGTVLPGRPPVVRIDAEHRFTDWMQRQSPQLAIDETTCATKWYAGDRMDWDLAVGHLFANQAE